jgi:endonuclease/exonuclease/phosphatase (EEP) superfamily protein YafD
MRFSLFLAILFMANMSHSSIQEPSKVFHIGTGSWPNSKLPNSFRWASWNIQKFSNNETSARLDDLANSMDVLFVQEDLLPNKQFETQNNHRENTTGDWLFAPSFSFQRNQWMTGVSTNSFHPMKFLDVLRSPDTEPFLHTPKLSLLTEINGILFINSHMINFVSTKKFKRQLESLSPYVDRYKNVVFGGDLNTWNPARFEALKAWASYHQLFPAETIGNDPRFLKLDHLFLKSCKSSGVQILHHINSSDHFPVFAEIQCPEDLIIPISIINSPRRQLEAVLIIPRKRSNAGELFSGIGITTPAEQNS